ISQAGMTFDETGAQVLRTSREVVVARMEAMGKSVPLQLHCRVVCSGKEQPVGAEIVAGTPTRDRFFDAVYYPLYLDYLERLSAVGGSSWELAACKAARLLRQA